MKLKNKKTGEIGKLHCDMNVSPAKYGVFEDTDIRGHYWEYGSLAELNSEWEDYAPKEPLIKDEKIRKAVRAWAEANSRDLFRVINEHFNCCKIIGYTDGGNASCNKIEFGTTISDADKDYYYTIDELCGEEEQI